MLFNCLDDSEAHNFDVESSRIFQAFHLATPLKICQDPRPDAGRSSIAHTEVNPHNGL